MSAPPPMASAASAAVPAAEPSPASPPLSAPLVAADLNVKIPLSSFFDHFQCSICLGELNRCALLRSCSHQFCFGCISECLNRRHVCPLCQCAATADSIVLNPAADHTLAAIKTAQRREKERRLKQILSGAAIGADGPASDDPRAQPSLPLLNQSSGSASAALSPMERVFRAEAPAKLMLPFEQAYQQIAAEAKEAEAAEAREAAAGSASAAAAASAPGGPAEPSSASALVPQPPQPESQSAFYARALPALVASYADYLQSLPAPLCLEPIYVNVTVQSAQPSLKGAGAASLILGPVVHLRLTMWPWEDLMQLARKIVAESTRPDQPASAAIRLCPLAPDRVTITLTKMSAGQEGAAAASSSAAGQAATPAALRSPTGLQLRLPLPLNLSPADLTRSFGELGLRGSCELTIKGEVEFANGGSASSSSSSPPAVCFMRVYDAALDQRVDYFKCAECALNWLCAACASTCHSGHTIAPFMIGHKPSYAACYCNKKKCCKLRVAK